MQILITGAAGSVGKQLSKYLYEVGHQIIPVDIVQHDKVICADLRDEANIFSLIQTYSPDLVLHLASIKDLHFCEQNKALSRATNYAITKTLTQA